MGRELKKFCLTEEIRTLGGVYFVKSLYPSTITCGTEWLLLSVVTGNRKSQIFPNKIPISSKSETAGQDSLFNCET